MKFMDNMLNQTPQISNINNNQKPSKFFQERDFSLLMPLWNDVASYFQEQFQSAYIESIFYMPILYKTSYKHSPISGMGLFAEEDIPKGVIWWVFDNNQKGVPCVNAPNLPNLILNEEAANKLVEGKSKEQVFQTLEHTMYYADAEVLLPLRDGSGVVNHSFEPNSQVVYNEEKRVELLKSITLRDIKAGQEIMENYSFFPKLSNNWSEAFLRKYVPSRLEFQAQFGIKKIEQ